MALTEEPTSISYEPFDSGNLTTLNDGYCPGTRKNEEWVAERAQVSFYDVVLRPDPSRTVVRPFEPGYLRGFDGGRSRTQEVIDHIVDLGDAELDWQLTGVTASLDENHRDVDATLLRRFAEMADRIPGSDRLSTPQRRLIGAYFSQEYAYEAAALFNPSAVLHPDQTSLAEGSVRFVLSLRGIGEGHVSSVTFRTGVWTPGGALEIDDPGPTSVPPLVTPQDRAGGGVHLDCGGSRTVSETVLFPLLPSQQQGIEDVRLGSGLIDQSQKMTVAAMQIADMKVWAQRS